MNIMQDQPQYNITPDQGWARLKPALDEAMPTGRSSRRFAWWWISSIMVLVAVIGFNFFKGVQASSAALPLPMEKANAGDTRKTMPSTPSTDPAASTPASPSLMPDQTTRTPESQEASQMVIPSGTKAKRQEAKSTAPAASQNQKTKTKTSTSFQPARVSSPMAKSTMPVFLPEASGPEANNTVGETASLQAQNETTTSESEYATSGRQWSVTSPIPGIDEMALDGARDQEINFSTITANRLKPRPHLLEPYLYMNALAGINSSSGWSGGAGLQVNIGRKLSLLTAAGYMTYNPNTPLVGAARQLDANYTPSEILNYDPTYNNYDPYLIGEAVNRTAGYNAISTVVDHVTQWQWSTGVKWKWSSRFYSDAGGTLGFGTHAYSQYPIFNVDPLTATPSAVTSGNSLSAYNVVRSNTLSAYLGLGYRIGRHIDLYTAWTHAFDHYLDVDTTNPNTDTYTEDRTDYIRGLNIGLRWTL